MTEAAALVYWLPTYSGKQFDPANPDPSQICLLDIAHALSQQCRYAGHSKRFYSVAEHSVRITRACSQLNKKHALLHDASEAYIIDLPRPIKRQPEIRAIYAAMEERAMNAIYTKFGLTPEMPEEVALLDNAILLVEMPHIYMFPENHSPNCLDAVMPDVEFPGMEDYGWTPQQAKETFLSLAQEIGLHD